jgi:hypothetical protein
MLATSLNGSTLLYQNHFEKVVVTIMILSPVLIYMVLGYLYAMSREGRK